MKHILLINPGHDDEHERHKHTSHRKVHRDPPPVGLLYVGSYLAKHGFQVDIVDTHVEANFEERIRALLAQKEYVLVGMSVIVGKFLKNAAELTSLIKSVIEIPIVWGGIMASIEPEACLRTYRPDYIVRFEGEKTALDLALAISLNTSVEHIRGISYMKGDKVIHNPPQIPSDDLDEYPVPKWHILGNAFNKEQVPYYHMIMSSRGCPFNCSFCYKHSIDHEIRARVPPWRKRSSQHVIAELEYMHQETGTRVFTFGDDNFLVHKPRAMEILNHCRRRNFFVEECVGHLNCLDDDLIESMAGVVQTFIFSIETASRRLQGIIQKSLDLESVPGKVKKLYDRGIATASAFIIGLPTETDEDLRQNVELMLELKKHHPFARATAYLYLPLPKTKLYKLVEETYHLRLPSEISDWEEANIWVLNADGRLEAKYRPWLSEERLQFLLCYGMVFRDVFKTNNVNLDPATVAILDKHDAIRQIFSGVERANCPTSHYIPYVLDRVLSGDQIDLVNDLKGK